MKQEKNIATKTPRHEENTKKNLRETLPAEAKACASVGRFVPWCLRGKKQTYARGLF